MRIKSLLIRNSVFFSVFFIFLLYSSFTLCGRSVSADLPVDDSLLTERYIRKIFLSDPHRALILLDEAESKSPRVIPQYKIDLYRASAYNELRMFSLGEKYSRKVLESDSVAFKPKVRLQAMSVCLFASSYYADYIQSAPLANEAIALAREVGNKPAEFYILQTIADISFKTGDAKDGYNYLQQVIDQGSLSNDIRILANVSSAYGSKIAYLYTDKRYQEALSEITKRLLVIEKLDSLGGAPEGFSDQQRAYTYAREASLAELSGQKKRARDAYKSFLSTKYGNTVYGRAFIIDYLLESGKYRDALSYLQPLYEAQQQSDTINEDYYGILAGRARACSGIGDMKDAYKLSLRAAAIQDSLFMRERRNRAQELAINFKMNEKELALVKSQAEAQRIKILVFAACGVLLILFIGAVILLLRYRTALQRNKIAARQIDELISQKENSYQFPAISDSKNSSDYADFLRMEKNIVENTLFLQRNFNRDVIAEKCGMTRSRVSVLIQQFANLSPGDYINKLKIQYSVKLINEHKEWTIDAIAEEAGYSNRSTYYQNFYKVFGITPAQYRRQTEDR